MINLAFECDEIPLILRPHVFASINAMIILTSMFANATHTHSKHLQTRTTHKLSELFSVDNYPNQIARAGFRD